MNGGLAGGGRKTKKGGDDEAGNCRHYTTSFKLRVSNRKHVEPGNQRGGPKRQKTAN